MPSRNKRSTKSKRRDLPQPASYNDDASEAINVDDYDFDDNEAEQVMQEQFTEEKRNFDEQTIARLKRKVTGWLDYDDKIRTLNAKTKKYKDAKKQQEDLIIRMINRLQIANLKIDVKDDNDKIRSRVYQHKSVTKQALKEDIIKAALMEAIRDEKKVDQLVKKIEDKRPIKERYYLKRTKGNKND